MQHMIGTIIRPGTFDGDEVKRLFHNGNCALVPARVAANRAGVFYRDVAAGRAKFGLGLDIAQGIGQIILYFIGRTQQKIGQTRSRLGANPRQGAQGFD